MVTAAGAGGGEVVVEELGNEVLISIPKGVDNGGADGCVS